jgi:hypothetical protein
MRLTDRKWLAQDDKWDMSTKADRDLQTLAVASNSGWGALVAHRTDHHGVTGMLNYDVPQS